jgi:predicted ATPase
MASIASLSLSSDKMEDMAVDQAAPIFGRDRELAELTAALGLDPGAAATGESVLLGGDAGIGKTRVVTELVTAAREADRRVLVGHCLDLGDSAMPFQPLSRPCRSWSPTSATRC